jgi:Secretion system C-terminal sorting domain
MRMKKSMKTMLFSSLFIVTHCAFSQWSTSTSADSALYVCPGFVQTILTFDDGSSIICGALNDSRYAQKLDPYGYKVWPQPVQIMNTPGTGNDGISTPISDGDGGCFVLWSDYRGADYRVYDTYTFYFNDAMYMQHIDKNGNVTWQTGGLQVDSVAGGQKWGYGVADGEGGIVIYMCENIYDTSSGAFVKAHTWLVRYDGSGQKIWMTNVDTSSSSFYSSQPTKLGNKIMVSTLKGFRFIDPIKGEMLTAPSFIPNGKFIVDGDSSAFNIHQLPDQYDSTGMWVYKIFTITAVNSNWDSIWSNTVKYKLMMNVIGKTRLMKITGDNTDIVQTDQLGGLFHCYAYNDSTGFAGLTVRWVNRNGVHFQNDEVKMRTDFAQLFGFNGKGVIGIFNLGTGVGQKFDTTGKKLWKDEDTLLTDLSEAYSPLFANDNNGGGIIAYWTTIGGIYAFETGRTGKAGVITKVTTNVATPLEFELSQNFPNPFNPTTTIRFSVNKYGRVTLKIFDILGREVATLVNKNLEQGTYEVVWSGGGNASGVYCYVLHTNNATFTKKMILLR